MCGSSRRMTPGGEQAGGRSPHVRPALAPQAISKSDITNFPAGMLGCTRLSSTLGPAMENLLR
jgi:hypothetical protein